jgi:hypothetical protein
MQISKGITQQEIYESTYIQNLKAIQKKRNTTSLENFTKSKVLFGVRGSSMSFNTNLSRINDHLDFVNSDYAKLKEITTRLNISMKQRLNKFAFDQQTHVNDLLNPTPAR